MNIATLEHDFANVIRKMEAHGVCFDERKAYDLDARLSAERNKLQKYGRNTDVVSSRLQLLSEGDQAWIRLARKGRIHGTVDTNGAISGRCTHTCPNMASTPSVKVEWGQEFRELIVPTRGYRLIGVDANAIELRCLAHYLYHLDNGEYVSAIVNGDIHETNRLAAGLPSRDTTKKFVFAWIYGAGYGKLAKILSTDEQTARAIVRNFLSRISHLSKLRSTVERTLETRGYIRGLDGRHLIPRNNYGALNILLQSAGAIAMKAATVILYEDLSDLGYTFGKEWALVLHVHDEMQIEARVGLEDTVAKAAVESIRKAGVALNLKCPLDGKAIIGNNWAETH
jgi:DNA polymerase I-like protein with 3'-5' exonuclease and polymerase domains